jgi:sulfate adenylyltransferase subunit 1
MPLASTIELLAGDAALENFSIEEFLAVEESKDLLRFTTAGSVDDGKSTLIGRLLYDSKNVYEDHVRAVTRTHGTTGTTAAAAIDFALLTDGLRAEREQGITIDVAYRYFSTARRKFIIADTPGHEQYTRNMATGASTADLAIILVDARKGILNQSRRHAYIAALLGIPRVIAAINKMDLVEYSEQVFAALSADFADLASRVGLRSVEAIPVSALEGDNVVHASANMPWYAGPALLESLEAAPVARENGTLAFRLPVQRVSRPHQNFRGFAGQIAAGTVRRGDRVVALPSGATSRVASIVTFDGELESASAPLSITLTLEDERDISRGDLIAAADAPPLAANHFEASVVWMNAQPLEIGKRYLLKHTSQTVPARVRSIRHRINIETLEPQAASSLELNAIGVVEVETDRPVMAELYQESRAMGSFILIDALNNATVGAGMIRHLLTPVNGTTAVTNRAPGVVVANAATVAAVEERLLAMGVAVVRTRVQDVVVWRALLAAGVIVLVEREQAMVQMADAERSLRGVQDGSPEAIVSALGFARGGEGA